MFLYLIRHAQALESPDDTGRRLSPLGCLQMERLAAFWRASAPPPPAEIWHSSLARAGETARLLKEGAGWQAPMVEVEGLHPEGDPRPIIARVNASEQTLALVGHEPFLGAMGALLVRSSPWPPVFLMRKSGVLALERSPGHGSPWSASWHLSPELFGLESG
jgi:phosphohistidine phosphatase